MRIAIVHLRGKKRQGSFLCQSFEHQKEKTTTTTTDIDAIRSRFILERRNVMVLRIFFISTTGRREIRKGQIHLFSVLSSWKFPYEAIDLGAPENDHERTFVLESGKKSDDGHVVLPQIFHHGQCCGDYRDFLDAIEHENMSNFLKQTN